MFNPQALQDPGPTAAGNMLSSNIASLLGQQNQQSANRTGLLKALLSGGAGIGQQLLSNKGARDVQGLKNEQDLLQFQRQLELNQGLNNALVQAMGGGQGMPVNTSSPTGEPTITENPLSPSLTPPPTKTIFPGLAADEQFMPDTGLKGQDLTFDQQPKQSFQAGLSATAPVAPANTQGQPGGVNLSAFAFLPTEKFLKVADVLGKTPEGQRKLEQVVKLRRENRIGDATEDAQISKTISESTSAQIKTKTDKVSGDIIDRFNNVLEQPQRTDESKPVSVFDPLTSNKVKLEGLPLTPELQGAVSTSLAEFATSPNELLKVRKDIENDSTVVFDLLSTLNEIEGLMSPGVTAQIKRRIDTNDFVIDLTGSNVNAATKAKAKSMEARLTLLARNLGERGVVTEPDVTRVRSLLGDFLGGKERFVAANNEAHRVLLSPVLTKAGNTLSAKTWNPGNKLFKQRFGADYPFNSPSGVANLQGRNIGGVQPGTQVQVQLPQSQSDFSDQDQALLDNLLGGR